MEGTVKNSMFEFPAKFCNELDKTKNCVFSPLVVAEITMSTNALKNCDPSIDKFCSIASNETSIPSNWPSPKLKSLKKLGFHRACKVYLNIERYKVDTNKKKYVKKMFDVKIKNIDFSNSVHASHLVNAWVEKRTKRKIKCFLKYNDFDVDTNVILVSGLYFKGIWHMKFDPDDTEETIFYLNNNETVNVFLMHRKDKYKYKDSPGLEAQLLLLPFKGEKTHMLIVLPKRRTGLDAVLKKLAVGYDLMEDVQHMSNIVEGNVNIPRFKIESEINIVETYRKLGITTIFDKAVQKVVIDVSEDGSEPKPEPLKGGTVIPRWKPRPIDFIADHPHLIVILCDNIPTVWITFRGRFE